jgi:hypothetical protein
MIEERKKEHVPSNTSTHKQQHALPHARCFDVFNIVAEVIVWMSHALFEDSERLPPLVYVILIFKIYFIFI